MRQCSRFSWCPGSRVDAQFLGNLLPRDQALLAALDPLPQFFAGGVLRDKQDIAYLKIIRQRGQNQKTRR